MYRYESLPLEAGPEIMALNPGPMTFRGKGSSPGVVLATTFDHTERAAHALRERGIKPQVFLYHPGHLDLLEYLITHDALDAPYFVQLVFGQQSGIGTSPDNVFSMVRNLPPGCIFQTCALGLEAVQVNTLAILLGGHVRTGMEDCIDYQRDEPARDNAQLVGAGGPNRPGPGTPRRHHPGSPGHVGAGALPANIHQTAEGAIHGRSFPR